MKTALLLITSLFTICVANQAEAGCRCGGSYIADWKTCYKCVCECPNCSYLDCAVPQVRMTMLTAAQMCRVPVLMNR